LIPANPLPTGSGLSSHQLKLAICGVIAAIVAQVTAQQAPL
jgi:hypothetical protein